MRIVIAPDKFKGSLTAPEVARFIAGGVRSVCPDADIDLCPLADGGDGTVAALVEATGGRLERRRVVGPLPEMHVDATFGVTGDGGTAIVEMAAASGLALLKPDERDPAATTTFGTGQLLIEAAKLLSRQTGSEGAATVREWRNRTTGFVENPSHLTHPLPDGRGSVQSRVRRIILGIGGSATIDGGIGCLQAIGLPVLLEGGEPTSDTEPLCGRDLDRVVFIKHGRGSPVEGIELVVACDVTNPLFGPSGAAAVYGPQKGATPGQIAWFDAQLQRIAERTGKLREANTPGAGAAGGLGFGLLAYFPGAALRPGVDIVFDAVNLRDRLRGADLCITGEGRLDASSLHGKAPVAAARLCAETKVPCVAIVGSQQVESEHAALFHRVEVVQTVDMSLAQSIDATPERLRALGAAAIRGVG